MQSIKEHNLKANHNLAQLSKFIFTLYAIYQRTQSESKSQLALCGLANFASVCNLSKNTIWKQITTGMVALMQPEVCMQSIKEHNLKANHNRRFYCVCILCSVCNLSKNTIWKQITTINNSTATLYFCMQSIKEHNLKANHNPKFLHPRQIVSVCNLSKNTIWKQITTSA